MHMACFLRKHTWILLYPLVRRIYAVIYFMSFSFSLASTSMIKEGIPFLLMYWNTYGHTVKSCCCTNSFTREILEGARKWLICHSHVAKTMKDTKKENTRDAMKNQNFHCRFIQPSPLQKNFTKKNCFCSEMWNCIGLYLEGNEWIY